MLTFQNMTRVFAESICLYFYGKTAIFVKTKWGICDLGEDIIFKKF